MGPLAYMRAAVIIFINTYIRIDLKRLVNIYETMMIWGITEMMMLRGSTEVRICY